MGTRKSLCFILPAASCPGRLIVVIILLISLQGNLINRYQKLKISYAKQRSNKMPGDILIIFITPKSAITKRFLDFLESWQVIAKVDQVIINKCHIIIEGSLSFRPKLYKLGTLALVGVQIIYLTAILLPADKPAFFSLINVQHEDIIIIRARIIRRNIAYSIRSVLALTIKEVITAIIKEAKVIINQKLEEYLQLAKIIIYCQ